MQSSSNRDSGVLKTLTIPSFAKINLGLRVLRKRTDGYHDIETVFLRIGWSDLLTFGPSKSLQMTTNNALLPVDEQNLCVKAVLAYRKAQSDRSQGVQHSDRTSVIDPTEIDQENISIHLNKKIPFGAGLGGGSSDAATVLLACQSFFGNERPLTEEELHAVAAQLGSDVPFFLGSPVAFGKGRGELLSPVPVPKALQDTFLLVVAPEIHVSTAEAYAGVVPNNNHSTDLKEIVLQGSLEEWSAHLANDFESSVFAHHPDIHRIKMCLVNQGAGFAQMSGSGSSVYGIYKSQKDLNTAKKAVVAQWPTARTWDGPINAAF